MQGAWGSIPGQGSRSHMLRLRPNTVKKRNKNKYWYFPGGSEVKASACNEGDLGSIPGSGRSPGEGNGNPLQYSCLEKPMGGGAWWATLVHGVIKSRTWLSNFTLGFLGKAVSLCFCETCLYKCSQRVKINYKEQKIKWKRKTDETTKIIFKSQNPNEQTDQGLWAE